MLPELDQPVIDFLILADRAEAVNGKLYMMGGGWDRLTIVDFDRPATFSLAIGVLVPWVSTNEEHPLRVFLEHEDGTALEPQIEAAVNVGRPPISVKGQSFRAMITVNSTWKLPGPGTYRAVAVLSSGESKRTTFHALAATARLQVG